MTTNSILQKYHRTPKIYVTLVSGKKHYDSDVVEYTSTGEIGILPMTAKDEMVLKNPDALLNGDAITRIITSCVPSIKDPNKLLAPDVEILLLGIFYSSYGHTIKFSGTCPKCKYENDYDVEIRRIIDTSKQIELPHIISFDEPKMKIFVRPFTHDLSTRSSLMAFENTKMIQILTDEKISDEDKLKGFGESFEKMTQANFDCMLECIEKIVVEEGQETDKQNIREFLFNADSGVVNPIREAIKTLNSSGTNNNFQAKCRKCDHEWETRVEFNPTNFFVQSSRS